MKVLVTGALGFIGSHVAKALHDKGYEVVAIDVALDHGLYGMRKKDLLDGIEFHRMDISSDYSLEQLFKTHNFDSVINLAAESGVLRSRTEPLNYVKTNVYGFTNILILAHKYQVANFIYASSSSVYGGAMQGKDQVRESEGSDLPVSVYAATKKSNELIAHGFYSMEGYPSIGLRFFTVYGPYGRQDMAPWIFTNKVFSDSEITLYNGGNSYRDFTFIDDVVTMIVKLAEKPNGQYRIFNIGSEQPILVNDFLSLIEKYASKKAITKHAPLPKGDVVSTGAYSNSIKEYLGVHYYKFVNPETGLKIFVDWYKEKIYNS